MKYVVVASRYSLAVYVFSGVLFVVSSLVVYFSPMEDPIRNFAAVPAIASALAALFQIMRDQATHERAVALQRDEQRYNLGITSHMANVAFDKHVEFCERYIKRMQEGLAELFAKGTTKDSLNFFGELVEIRLAFRAWITEDLENRILPFEQAVRTIGVKRILLEELKPGEDRTRHVKEMHDAYANVLGIGSSEGDVDEEVAPRRIIWHLQQLLGVEQLSRLRVTMINEAISALESSKES